MACCGIADAVFVEDGAVEKVEGVAGQDGGEDHGAPVLAHAGDAEGVGDERGINAEENAVGEAGEGGDEEEVDRVGDCEGGGLGGGEDAGGEKEAPESAAIVAGYENVAADAGEQPTGEGGEGEERDVENLAFGDKGTAGAGVVC